ncbi:overproduction-induced pheromone-resistant [Emydomyces testavorans]|uniref:Overproduction-induced pheromone-resistant n=1 Tax=Emydomyces testavorans TaxID=2070801 RepID=A0AAF0DK38_9EURO|nr:overproduction-induced pheromone-resistant [Emydomyces testavorans]
MLDTTTELPRAISWRHAFRRCVVGCPDQPDPCPDCPSGQECISHSATCDSCMKNVCVPIAQTTPPAPPAGPNIGAIAGGVIGGIAILVVLVVVGWYYVKKRKAEAEADGWAPELMEKQEAFAAERRGRMSAVGSIASTVLTRASNVIQIAYIPGVTNRSPPESPSMIPPVPPIPAAQGGDYDQRYFMPGDIRDSVWSGMSDETRRSIAPSLARSSVATTIYRNDAVVSPVPAQQALRAKAAMVSVRSGSNTPALSNSSPTSATTPAVPAITVTQISKANALAARMEKSSKLPMSSIVARTAVARPINVTKQKPKRTEEDKKVSPTTPIDDEEAKDSPVELPTHEMKEPQRTKSKNRESAQSNAVTLIDDSPVLKQSAFANSGAQIKPSGTSSAIPEEISNGSRDSSAPPTHRHRNSLASNRILDGQPRRLSDATDPSSRKASPFSDDNEIK